MQAVVSVGGEITAKVSPAIPDNKYGRKYSTRKYLSSTCLSIRIFYDLFWLEKIETSSNKSGSNLIINLSRLEMRFRCICHEAAFNDKI